MLPLKLLPLLAIAILAMPAAAQTMYKLVDKKGKVTYAEKIPPGFDGQATRMDIDPNRNTATLPKPGATPGEGVPVSKDTETLRRDAQKRSKEEERIEKAKDKLEQARQRLQDLKDNPTDDDIVRLGKVGGGTRPAFSDEYLARIEKAEAAVKAAEEELERVTSGR